MDIIQQLTSIKEKLIEWPNGSYLDKNGNKIDPDTAFSIIEVDLKSILDKMLALPESERVLFKDIVEDFKNTIAQRQKETENHLQELREKVNLNQGMAKAINAYGKTFGRQQIKGGETDESNN